MNKMDYRELRRKLNKGIEMQAEFKTNNTINALNTLQNEIHQANVQAGWWTDLSTNMDLAEEVRQGTRLGKALVAEKLCLIHSEISEAMEGPRKNLKDDKLPHRPMLEVEMADAVIRIMDLAGAMKLDIGGAIQEKLSYNATREDHQIKNRKEVNGKSY